VGSDHRLAADIGYPHRLRGSEQQVMPVRRGSYPTRHARV
jgi:hypothetical protein